MQVLVQKHVQDRHWHDRADVVDLVKRGAAFFACGDGGNVHMHRGYARGPPVTVIEELIRALAPHTSNKEES